MVVVYHHRIRCAAGLRECAISRSGGTSVRGGSVAWSAPFQTPVAAINGCATNTCKRTVARRPFVGVLPTRSPRFRPDVTCVAVSRSQAAPGAFRKPRVHVPAAVVVTLLAQLSLTGSSHHTTACRLLVVVAVCVCCGCALLLLTSGCINRRRDARALRQAATRAASQARQQGAKLGARYIPPPSSSVVVAAAHLACVRVCGNACERARTRASWPRTRCWQLLVLQLRHARACVARGGMEGGPAAAAPAPLRPPYRDTDPQLQQQQQQAQQAQQQTQDWRWLQEQQRQRQERGVLCWSMFHPHVVSPPPPAMVVPLRAQHQVQQHACGHLHANSRHVAWARAPIQQPDTAAADGTSRGSRRRRVVARLWYTSSPPGTHAATRVIIGCWPHHARAAVGIRAGDKAPTAAATARSPAGRPARCQHRTRVQRVCAAVLPPLLPWYSAPRTHCTCGVCVLRVAQGVWEGVWAGCLRRLSQPARAPPSPPSAQAECGAVATHTTQPRRHGVPSPPAPPRCRLRPLAVVVVAATSRLPGTCVCHCRHFVTPCSLLHLAPAPAADH